MTNATSENTHMPPFYASTDATVSKVREALREVIDPELGLNVVELGLIRDFDPGPADEKASLTMILTTPFCPYGPAMMQSVRNKTEEVTGKPVAIEMGLEMWDPSMMEEGAGGDWGLF